MNEEAQIIGSLLLDQSRYDDVSFINSEMFTDDTLGKIFSAYEHSDREVNKYEIIDKIKSDVMTEKLAEEYLTNLVTWHDATISDNYCAERILREYKVRKFNEIIDHTKLTEKNVDSFFDELTTAIESFQKIDSSSEISSLSDLTSLSDTYFTDKNKPLLQTGFEELDRCTGGIDAGDVTLIAARPSVGKSALALQLIRKFGMDGLRVGYFNMEMSKKQVYERAVASASSIDLGRIRLGTNFLNNEKELFEKGNAQLEKEKNVFVINGMQTIRNIKQIQKKYRYDVVVIDYLQLIKTEKRNSRASEVGEISRGLKMLASDFNIPVIALSQLNRVSEQNKDKEPSMSELRESGDLEQDASTILMMWNPEKERSNEKMLKIEKSRNGVTARIKLIFDGRHMSFAEENFSDADMDEIPFD